MEVHFVPEQLLERKNKGGRERQKERSHFSTRKNCCSNITNTVIASLRNNEGSFRHICKDRITRYHQCDVKNTGKIKRKAVPMRVEVRLLWQMAETGKQGRIWNMKLRMEEKEGRKVSEQGRRSMSAVFSELEAIGICIWSRGKKSVLRCSTAFIHRTRTRGDVPVLRTLLFQYVLLVER